MGKVSTLTSCQKLPEFDMEILLRERIIKYLVSKEKGNFAWKREDHSRGVESTYEISCAAREVEVRYKIRLSRPSDKFVFRLCNVGFSEKNRRKGLLTGLMDVVKGFAPRMGIKALQVECPNTTAMQSWLKKNGYSEKTIDIWEKEV